MLQALQQILPFQEVKFLKEIKIIFLELLHLHSGKNGTYHTGSAFTQHYYECWVSFVLNCTAQIYVYSRYHYCQLLDKGVVPHFIKEWESYENIKTSLTLYQMRFNNLTNNLTCKISKCLYEKYKNIWKIWMWLLFMYRILDTLAKSMVTVLKLN